MNISLLQEYEENQKIIGIGRIRAMDKYISQCQESGKNILYSDIVYNQEEYELFSNWFEEYIDPFQIQKFEYNGDIFAITLNYDDFCYDWLNETKSDYSLYGNGHFYNDLFSDYLETNFNNLYKRIDFDSEMGMFDSYSRTIQDAEEVAYELATLYKDESKMLDLISKTKEKYNYKFEPNINI